jgi:hypothetical protein
MNHASIFLDLSSPIFSLSFYLDPRFTLILRSSDLPTLSHHSNALVSLKPKNLWITVQQPATLNFMISYETAFSAAQNPISKITYPLDSTTCTEQ